LSSYCDETPYKTQEKHAESKKRRSNRLRHFVKTSATAILKISELMQVGGFSIEFDDSFIKTELDMMSPKLAGKAVARWPYCCHNKINEQLEGGRVLSDFIEHSYLYSRIHEL
jgi:hypothetical protein